MLIAGILMAIEILATSSSARFNDGTLLRHSETKAGYAGTGKVATKIVSISQGDIANGESTALQGTFRCSAEQTRGWLVCHRQCLIRACVRRHDLFGPPATHTAALLSANKKESLTLPSCPGRHRHCCQAGNSGRNPSRSARSNQCRKGSPCQTFLMFGLALARAERFVGLCFVGSAALVDQAGVSNRGHIANEICRRCGEECQIHCGRGLYLWIFCQS